MEVRIEYATGDDLMLVTARHKGATSELLERRIAAKEVIVARAGGDIVGLLTYIVIWDVVPFINVLSVVEERRRQGIGRRLVGFFECEMAAAGEKTIMTSSMSSEDGQHFWRKMGYKDVGGVLPADAPLEVFFRKDLDSE